MHQNQFLTIIEEVETQKHNQKKEIREVILVKTFTTSESVLLLQLTSRAKKFQFKLIIGERNRKRT